MAHFEAAAARGHGAAHFSLGQLHEHGHLSGAVRKNPFKAAEW